MGQALQNAWKRKLQTDKEELAMTAQTAAAAVGIEQSVGDILSRPFAITYFKDFAARTKQAGSTTLPALAQRIGQSSRASKGQLLWLKLASFGTGLTEKSSLRHDANVLAISGVEGDYDGEKVSFDHAVEILSKAGILALVYTSPSHTEDTPRWRILCPTSGELPPDRRDRADGPPERAVRWHLQRGELDAVAGLLLRLGGLEPVAPG
ncbi:hypothetical protein [Dankookia sp. P2]|uniref:hypothetical protein n=1 Tax=Dankookia sp. P2 TaxID=3423955 RepID=UPI003D66F30E